MTRTVCECILTPRMTAAPRHPRKLQTAEDRREDVMRAAMQEFARRGYYGTPTTDIAKGAGISQAYLFRLFPTKEELFIACVERTYRGVHDAFTKAAAPHAGDQEAAIEAMGDAYDELLRNSDMLLCQLHGYAACQEPAIRVAVRQGYKELVELVAAPERRAATRRSSASSPSACSSTSSPPWTRRSSTSPGPRR